MPGTSCRDPIVSAQGLTLCRPTAASWPYTQPTTKVGPHVVCMLTFVPLRANRQYACAPSAVDDCSAWTCRFRRKERRFFMMFRSTSRGAILSKSLWTGIRTALNGYLISRTVSMCFTPCGAVHSMQAFCAKKWMGWPQLNHKTPVCLTARRRRLSTSPND